MLIRQLACNVELCFSMALEMAHGVPQFRGSPVKTFMRTYKNATVDMKIIRHGAGSVIHMKCNVEGKRKKSTLHNLGIDVHDL